MKPLYANFFGVSKTQNADGELVELTLNISHKYMEQQTTIGPNGVETISAPAMEQIASILLTPANARALRALHLRLFRTSILKATACPQNRKINQNLTRLAILLASRVFC
mgnify:CR=1 FL=1